MLSRALDRALRRVRRHGDDAGITLTELIVTMSLMSIVGALAITALLGTSKNSDQTTEAGLANAGARNVMSSWTQLLQVATIADPATPTVRNLSVTPTSLSFNAQLDNLPGCTTQCASNTTTQVTLQLTDQDTTGKGKLVQTLTRGTDVRTVTLVSSGVAVPANGCLFHAYQADGTDFGCTSLTADATTLVGRVDIAFTITPRVGPVQTFTSSAKLPGGAT